MTVKTKKSIKVFIFKCNNITLNRQNKENEMKQENNNGLRTEIGRIHIPLIEQTNSEHNENSLRTQIAKCPKIDMIIY